MNNSLLWKGVALAFLFVVLMVPLGLISGTIAERAAFRGEARQDIAKSWGGAQRLVGPMLVQRYEIRVVAEAWDERLDRHVETASWQEREVVHFPEQLDIRGDVTVEQRYRGIHVVPVYRADLALNAMLDVPAPPADARNVVNLLVIGVGDARGFREQPVLHVDDRPVVALPGTATDMGSGVHAVLDVPPGRHTVSASFALAGTERFNVAPLGGSTAMQLSSNWPHPRFTGGYLPEDSAIGATGFKASWRTSLYATTAREAAADCVTGGECDFAGTELVSLELADPVNVYLLNERSVKYGILFVLVVFGVFLVFEVLKRLPIHPVQYGMVGFGLSLFFLLLLSLSEHIAFGLAYLAGAAACVLLLTFYVSHVLRGFGRGAGFGVLLSGIYAALFVILKSEDYALLLGSLLLFGLLAAAMYLTRNVDWYAMSAPKGFPSEEQSTG